MTSPSGEAFVRNGYRRFLDGPIWPMHALAEALQATKGYRGVYGQEHAAEVIRDLFSTPLFHTCTDLEHWAPLGPLTRCCLARFAGRRPGDEEPGPAELWRELTEVYAQR